MGLRAFLARNTVRLQRIEERATMFLIDNRGMRPVCVACHRLGRYQETEPGVFICDPCVRAADAHLRNLPKAFLSCGIIGSVVGGRDAIANDAGVSRASIKRTLSRFVNGRSIKYSRSSSQPSIDPRWGPPWGPIFVIIVSRAAKTM
jgi:hypothetical protein